MLDYVYLVIVALCVQCDGRAAVMQASVFAFVNTCPHLCVNFNMIIKLSVSFTVTVISYCSAVAFSSHISSFSL